MSTEKKLSMKVAPKVEPKKMAIKKSPEELRNFIIEFTIGYIKDGERHVLNETVTIPNLESYPNRKTLLSEIPLLYGLTEEAGYTSIGINNIRITELTKQDFEDYLKE